MINEQYVSDIECMSDGWLYISECEMTMNSSRREEREEGEGLSHTFEIAITQHNARALITNHTQRTHASHAQT